MKLRCRKCGSETPEELGFCEKCKTRLIPKSIYDLNFDDYAYGPDRDAIENLKVMGALPYLVRNLAVGDLEKTMLSRLSSEANRVTYPSDLDRLLRQCATSLSVEVLPEVFIVQGEQLNAFTFGTEERAFVVLDSSILRFLTSRELMAILGHELGHVKSGHMLYHTLGEVLGGGINLSASLLGLKAVSIPIRLGLLSWHRESEVTADRTSLLAVNDIRIINSLMIKLAAFSPRGGASSAEFEVESGDVGVLESLSELFRTHPLYANRFRLVKEFADSEEFLRARRKIERRQRTLRALIPKCRFCGADKPTAALFCPICRRAQM